MTAEATPRFDQPKSNRPPFSAQQEHTTSTGDRVLYALTTAATVIILAMLVIVLADVVIGGSRVLSWEFISAAPRDGMTRGASFRRSLAPSR